MLPIFRSVNHKSNSLFDRLSGILYLFFETLSQHKNANPELIKKLFVCCFFLMTQTVATSQWINEIHYDNVSTDMNECIEIVGPAGTDMSCYSIVLYNGNTSSSYDTDALSGLIPDEGCGYGAISICYSTNGIQNGAPDGIVLYNTCTASVVQFLSYEGSFTATSGVANGMSSTDVGVSESSSTAVGSSMQLIGIGSNYGAFTWESVGNTASMGTLNTGQTISPCGSNTITTVAVSTPPFTVDCTAPSTDAGSVTFTSTGTYNAGNEYTVQLSDASGSFSSPINVGLLASTANSGLINFTIPSAISTGTGLFNSDHLKRPFYYRIKQQQFFHYAKYTMPTNTPK